MTLYRREGETQRAFVERTLLRDGSVSAYDVLYDAAYEDGAKTSVTRLAAIVHELRGDGWDLSEHAGHNRLAVYSLAVAKAAPKADPYAWRRLWACASCGGQPATEPVVLLGGMGQAHCAADGRRTYFRSTARRDVPQGGSSPRAGLPSAAARTA